MSTISVRNAASAAIGKIRYYDTMLEKVVEFDNYASWLNYYKHRRCDHETKKTTKEKKRVCNIVTFPVVLSKKN